MRRYQHHWTKCGASSQRPSSGCKINAIWIKINSVIDRVSIFHPFAKREAASMYRLQKYAVKHKTKKGYHVLPGNFSFLPNKYCTIKWYSLTTFFCHAINIRLSHLWHGHPHSHQNSPVTPASPGSLHTAPGRSDQTWDHCTQHLHGPTRAAWLETTHTRCWKSSFPVSQHLWPNWNIF